MFRLTPPQILCVAIGFRARAAAFVLCTTLLTTNLVMNAWWAVPEYQQDYVRYEVSTCACIGWAPSLGDARFSTFLLI